MKKRILCFGDSNTWGYNGETCERFDENTRWTAVLAKSLGEKYTVIEEGQNGRTTVWDDPVECDKNGLKYLPPCLESHAPLDMVIIMLGTNDLKNRFNVGPCEIAISVAQLAAAAKSPKYGREGRAPAVILLSPIHIGAIEKSRFSYMFDRSCAEKSKQFAPFYKQIADEAGCLFYDAATVAGPDESDYLHMDPGGHKALGEMLAREISSL
jgi:lysophospholipase L1-like esterase